MVRCNAECYVNLSALKCIAMMLMMVVWKRSGNVVVVLCQVEALRRRCMIPNVVQLVREVVLLRSYVRLTMGEKDEKMNMATNILRSIGTIHSSSVTFNISFNGK